MLKDKVTERDLLARELQTAMRASLNAVDKMTAKPGDSVETLERTLYEVVADVVLRGEWMVEFLTRARDGISMRLTYCDEGGYLVCPSCETTRFTPTEAEAGKICDECRRGLLEAEVLAAARTEALRDAADSTSGCTNYMFQSAVHTWLMARADAIDAAAETTPAGPEFALALFDLASRVENLASSRNLTLTNTVNFENTNINVRAFYVDAATTVRMGC